MRFSPRAQKLSGPKVATTNSAGAWSIQPERFSMSTPKSPSTDDATPASPPPPSQVQCPRAKQSFGWLTNKCSRDAASAFASCGHWCVGGEQVVGIAGIDKIGTAGAQQSFHLLDCLLDHTARLAGLNLVPQLDERLIGVVQMPCQDCCNVKECDRVYPEQGGRIGDVKLRGFQRTYIRHVRLIQKHGEFAEHGTGLRHCGDLDAFVEDRDRALPKDQQPAGRRGGSEHGLAGLVGCDRKAGELPLEYGDVGN